MATRRKARKPTTRRAATGTAKIRVHTDEYGRKVYTVVGTKKYAYTLAKAKELAAKKAPKKRASSKKSTALTTTRKRKPSTKRTTVAKRKPTTRRRTTGAKRNAKGQFVKAGRKTARRATRRNPTQNERLSEMLDNRMFVVEVYLAEKVGDVERRVRALKSRSKGTYTPKTILRGVYDTVFEETKRVRGRHAALTEAMRLMNAAIGEENARKYFYREDIDHGRDAGNVYFRPKRGTDKMIDGYVYVEAYE